MVTVAWKQEFGVIDNALITMRYRSDNDESFSKLGFEDFQNTLFGLYAWRPLKPKPAGLILDDRTSSELRNEA